MKSSLRASITLAVVSAFAGCIVPDPATKKVEQEFVCGTRSETGERMVGRERFRPYLHSLTPVGKLDGNRWIEYSLVRGGDERRLKFLDEDRRRSDPSNNPLMLHEFLPLRGTSRWAAFRVTRMTRSEVDLQLIIFDGDGVRSTHRIERAIRHLNRGDRLAAYSTALDPSSGLLTVATEAGWFAYHPAEDRLVRLAPDPGSSVAP